MEFWQETVLSLFLVTAGLFGLVGSFGLIKLPNPITRLHAPTKATTLGLGGVLIASMLHSVFINGVVSFHELLITLFLFLTAPITAHFIAKIHLHQTVSRDNSPTGTDSRWASEPEQPESARNETAE